MAVRRLHRDLRTSCNIFILQRETMRQLKGKVKENAKEKKERKKEFAENREKAFSV